MRHFSLTVLLLAAIFLTGCASYAVRSSPANLAHVGVGPDERQRLTDYTIQEKLDRKPLAGFPTAIAVAHIQDSSAGRYYGRYGHGNYSLVTARQRERDEHLQKLAELPMVTGIAPIGRLILDSDLQSDLQLRDAAAALHADVLLVYTFDTQVFVDDSDSPLDLVTLGFLPGRRARVHSTASAAVMDTRNGYLYLVAEGVGEHDQPANMWTTRAAVDASRAKAEGAALGELLQSITEAWTLVVRDHATATELDPQQ